MGGRSWIENYRIPEGILQILGSGAHWQHLSEKHPNCSTCWRRSRDGEEQGVWLNIWRTFLNELNERRQLEFHSPEKRVQELENQAGQGTKWMEVVDSAGAPLRDLLHSASPAEVRLAKTVLAVHMVLEVCSSWSIGQ
jgi:transposase